MDVYTKLGKRIRALRKQAGLTQSGLAERAGLSDNYVGQIERGEARPTLDILCNISRSLRAPISRLFNFPEDQPKKVSDVVERLTKNLAHRDLRDAELVLYVAERIAEYATGSPKSRRHPP